MPEACSSLESELAIVDCAGAGGGVTEVKPSFDCLSIIFYEKVIILYKLNYCLLYRIVLKNFFLKNLLTVEPQGTLFSPEEIAFFLQLARWSFNFLEQCFFCCTQH